MAVLTVRARFGAARNLLVGSLALALCSALAGCSAVPGALPLGSAAEFPAGSDTPAFHIRLEAVEFARECPNRVVEGDIDTGDFLFLTIEAELSAEAADRVVSTSPERFRALDANGQVVGGFNEQVGWECFSDSVLLPMVLAAGDSGAGLVVIEAPPQARFVEFRYSDSESAHWEIGDAPES